MSLLPDPADLYATADRIARHADGLRHRAATLAAAAARARWYSPAAGTFQAEVDGVARQMRHAAARVDDAADALRRHARVIENELVLLARAAHAVVSVAGAVADGVEHSASTIAGGVEHAAGRVLDAVGFG